MICMSCGSKRVAGVSGKTSDLCIIEINGLESDGYVPNDMNIGGGDYLQFDLCLDCGHVNGDWPLSKSKLEEEKEEEED